MGCAISANKSCTQRLQSLNSALYARNDNTPEVLFYAAVAVISEVDDEGFHALDRSSFAPGLTPQFTRCCRPGRKRGSGH
jgi:hypothetical protein